MSTSGAWLQDWWTEMDADQRQRWLALPAGGDVPADLARAVVTFAGRQRRLPPVVGTEWAGRGVSGWHVAQDVWDFIDERRPPQE